jgi:hypothetical protein
MSLSRLITAATLALLLAGCAAGGAGVSRPATTAARSPAAAGQRPASNTYLGYRQPVEQGVLIGRDRNALVAQFGQPRLDIVEGPARKLQFTGTTCVLDAYLYPPQGGGEPVVTHVDARTLDGADTDSAACAGALGRR